MGIIILVYVIGCIVAYGMLFAHLQRKWPMVAGCSYYKDILICIGLSLPSWISVITYLLMGIGGYGLKFK